MDFALAMNLLKKIFSGNENTCNYIFGGKDTVQTKFPNVLLYEIKVFFFKVMLFF